MLTPHPTHAILDSSKLQTFLTCERMYFYEYILGWRREAVSNHLVFGQAAHHAFEHLLLHGYGNDAVLAAYELFETHYRDAGFTEDTDPIYFPKTPERMLTALVQYTQRYAADLERYEVLHTEVSGTVPLGEGRKLHFRWDSVLRDRHDELIVSMEHKTGSPWYTWEMQWPLKFQIGTYTHGLYSLYEPQQVKGVIINGILFTKAKGTRGGELFDFRRVPVYRTVEQMQVWLWNTHDLLDRLQLEHDRLGECTTSDRVLQAFPLRTESCTNYGGCPYHDFCTSWSNPLCHIEHGPPPGFVEEWWDPRSLKATEVIEL